jgi:Patatin-like phospholipase
MRFEKSCYLWEAALATCAAPIFFSPVNVKGKVLVDGGLGHNSPTEHLISEAELRWPGRPIGAVVSIGTGKSRGNLPARDMKMAAVGKHFRALYHVALVLKHLATSSEARERSVYNYFGGMGKLECYYPLNVDQGMEIELHEYKKYDEIRRSTRKYLNTQVVAQIVMKCAYKLAGMHDEVSQLGRAPDASQDELSELAQVDSTERLATELEDISIESESRKLTKEVMDSFNPLTTDLKPLYQLHTASGSVAAITRPSRENTGLPLEAPSRQSTSRSTSNKPEGSSEAGEADDSLAQNKSIRPVRSLSLAFNTKDSESLILLEYNELENEQLFPAGTWEVHWLLLFRRHTIKGDNSAKEARKSESQDNKSPDPPPSPTYPQIFLTVTIAPEERSGSESQSTTLTSSTMLGVDIFLSDQWQDIPTEHLLNIKTGNENPTLGLDFSGWDEATSSLGEAYTWTIYFGGLR